MSKVFWVFLHLKCAFKARLSLSLFRSLILLLHNNIWVMVSIQNSWSRSNFHSNNKKQIKTHHIFSHFGDIILMSTLPHSHYHFLAKSLFNLSIEQQKQLPPTHCKNKIKCQCLFLFRLGERINCLCY